MRDALLAVVGALGEQRARAEECAVLAAAQAESAGWHGWDGVASGYETVREHLEEAVAGFGGAEEEVQWAVGLLAHLHEPASASDVSVQLALLVDQLAAVEATLDRTAGSVAEAARAAEVVGAEDLLRALQDLASGTAAAGDALVSIRQRAEEEQRAATETSAAAGKDGGDESSGDVSERIKNLRSQGHGPQRHGGQVTQEQLIDRVLRWIDPITGTTVDGEHGGEHKCARVATQVISDAAYVTAEASIRSSQDFLDVRAAAERDQESQIRLVLPLQTVLGPDYLRHVRGMRRNGSKAHPTGTPPGSSPPTQVDFTDGRMIAVYTKRSDGEFRLKTMFPDPPGID